MRRFASLLFNVAAYIMTTGLAVYVGMVTANSPHADPFGGYGDFSHILYLSGYLVICAVLYYISDRLN